MKTCTRRAAPGGDRARRAAGDKIAVTDRWGDTETYDAVLVACQSWLLTTYMQMRGELFSPKMWMALDRTRYMQSSKTFVMMDRPFWKDRDPHTGRDLMSMTLTDRLTRGTYLFDNGDDKPGVICLTYSWMSDAMKMLPLPVEKRVRLALDALKKIYPRPGARETHHRRSDHGVMGVGSQFPRRLQGRAARPLPL